MPEEPRSTIDVRNNPESRSGAADSHYPVARASDGGAPPKDAPGPGEQPEPVTGGTADGAPVAGVTIDAEDRAEAVPADEGPTELNDGPTMPGGA